MGAVQIENVISGESPKRRRRYVAAATTASERRERELIARIREGERELFTELIRPYERRVYVTAVAILQNEADAQDVAQEAILKAFTHLWQFRGESRFSTWLTRVTINEARMRRRKEHREIMKPFHELETPDEEGQYVPKDFTDWQEVPSEALERKEVRELLRAGARKPRGKISRGFRAPRRPAFEHRGNSRSDGSHTRHGEDAASSRATHAARSSRAGTRRKLGQPAAFREREQAMDIKCEEVWREISNYVDNEVDANLRAEMERHFAGCKHCSAVLDGTRNIVQIYGDERMFSVPAEFSPALQRRLAARLEPERSSKFSWLLSLAGAGLVAASLLIFSVPRFASPKLRAPMSEPALRAP